MSVLDRLLFVMTVLLSAYQVAVGIEGLNIVAVAAFTVGFGVLLVAALLILILGMDILDSPIVVIVSTIIPLGMSLAFAVVSALYLLVVFTTVGVVAAQDLNGSLVPLSLGAEATMGPWGVILVNIGGLLAFATTANAGILAASRTPLAMSRDGLTPEFLSRTNRRFGSPHVAIIGTTLFIMAVISFLSLEDLVKTASTMIILMFILQDCSVIIMRSSPRRWPRDPIEGVHYDRAP